MPPKLLQEKQIEFVQSGPFLPTVHRSYNQLVHNIAETSYEELNYTGSQLDSVILWTNSGKSVNSWGNIDGDLCLQWK